MSSIILSLSYWGAASLQPPSDSLLQFLRPIVVMSGWFWHCSLTCRNGLRVLSTNAMISLGKSADLLSSGHKGFLPLKSLPCWGRRLSSWSMEITLHRECLGRSEVLSSMNRNQHLGSARTFCRDRWESFEVPQKSRSPFRGLASLRLISMRWTLFAANAALLS